MGIRESWPHSTGFRRLGRIQRSGETMPLSLEPGQFMMSVQLRKNCSGKLGFVFPHSTLDTVPCSTDLTLFVLPACYLSSLAWLPNLEQHREPHQGQLELSWEGEFLATLVMTWCRPLASKTVQCFSCWTYDVIGHTRTHSTDSTARLIAFGQCHFRGWVALSNVSTSVCLRVTKSSAT